MKKAKRKFNLFDLSKRKQKSIIKEAAKEANKEQLDLDRRYDARYGNGNFVMAS